MSQIIDANQSNPRFWRAVTSTPVIIVGAVIMSLVMSWLISDVFNIKLTTNATWRLAIREEINIDGQYSPLPFLLASGWQRIFGQGAFSFILYTTLLLSISAVCIRWIAHTLFNRFSVTLLSVYLTLFSPYLMWSLFVGRDVNLDVAAVAVLMVFAVRIYQGKQGWDWLGFALAGAFATSVRESNIVTLPVLTMFFFTIRLISFPKVIVIAVAFAVGLTPLLVWNYIHTKTITLSTRSGYNLYIGNHPLYTSGHPIYDIDVFMQERARNDYGEMRQELTATELDSVYRQAAVEYIVAHPFDTAYRMLLKAYWWLGPTRIPMSDTVAKLDADEDIVHLEAAADSFKDVLYLVHRFVILVGILLYWKYGDDFSWRRSLLLLLPTLAVMVIAMVTFPDTRFRLALDPYTFMLSASGIAGIFRHNRAK